MENSAIAPSKTPKSNVAGIVHKRKSPVKKPLNAFMLFSQKERKKLAMNSQTEISKILGHRWKELTLTERAPFVKEATFLRNVYMKEQVKGQLKRQVKQVKKKKWVRQKGKKDNNSTGEKPKFRKEINKGAYTIVKFVSKDDSETEEEDDDIDDNQVEVTIEIDDAELLSTNKDTVETLVISDDDDDDVVIQDVQQLAPEVSLKNKSNSSSSQSNFYFTCEFCEFKSREKNNLKTHLANIHNLPIHCDRCNFRTIYKQHYDIHTTSAHTAKKLDKLESDTSHDQLTVLNMVFKKTKSVTKKEAAALSEEIQLDQDKIIQWFDAKKNEHMSRMQKEAANDVVLEISESD